MSAITAIVTPDAAYMLVDGLAYDKDEVTSVAAEKSFPISGMSAAVAATGDAKTALFFKHAIEQEFRKFDEVIEAGSEFFLEAFKAFAHRFCGGNAVSNVAIVGWSECHDRPIAFGIDLVEGMGKWVSNRDPDSHIGMLQELPILAVPSPSLEELQAASFPLGAAGDAVRPEDKLLHLMEVQRRIAMDDGKFYVGGQATLTTVTPDGVSQRAVQRWEEDKVGELVKPAPIDWKAWREKRATAGMSWLKRKMLLKKMRKAA